MKWQPIETAPKDGTLIIAMNIQGYIDCVSWTRFDTEDKEEIAKKIRIYGSYFGWFHAERVYSGGDMLLEENLSFEPTHWIPLPKPPTNRIASNE
ncbi:DUF551 domain-containing protein [bacterium]|nr:DUF551 domain-containing protein [bacterium]